MGIGFKELLVILAIIVFIFGGRGRISAFFSDLGRAVTSFRRGLAETEKEIEKEIESTVVESEDIK